jgi:hypothetical protein
VQNQGPAEQFQVRRAAQPGLLTGCECEGASTMQCSVRTRADAVGGARPKSILPGTTEGGIPESINPATRFAPCSRTLCVRALTLSHRENQRPAATQQKVFAWGVRERAQPSRTRPAQSRRFAPSTSPLMLRNCDAHILTTFRFHPM